MGSFDTAWRNLPAGATPGSSDFPITAEYLTAVDTQLRTERSDRVADALLTKLDQASASAVVVVLGDSTGVPGTGEWVGDWAALLGARWTGHKVTTRLWGSTSYGSASTVANGAAALTLDIYNGSVSGMTASYPVSRIAAMLPVQPDLVILNYGHNNGTDSPATFQSGLDSLVSAIRVTWANAPIVVTSQNPRFTPAGNIAEHAAREQSKRAWTATREYGYVPAWEAYQAQATPSAFVQSDGIHPTTSGVTDGSALWAKAVDAYLAGRTKRPTAASSSGSGSTAPASRDYRWFVPAAATSIDEFNDDTLDPAWTRVDGAGAPASGATWTEGADVMSLYQAGGDSSGTVRGLMRPLSGVGGAMNVGDAFVTCLRLAGPHTFITLGGIILSDSAAFGSGNQAMAVGFIDTSVAPSGGAPALSYAMFGATNWTGAASAGSSDFIRGETFHLRIVKTGASTWRCDASPDGVSWLKGSAVLTKAVTPTHVGLASSSWGTSVKGIVSYDYLRRVSGVS